MGKLRELNGSLLIRNLNNSRLGEEEMTSHGNKFLNKCSSRFAVKRCELLKLLVCLQEVAADAIGITITT